MSQNVQQLRELRILTFSQQITFDTPYLPQKEFGRVFDYVEMAQVVDFFMIMAYDMSADIPWANCPLHETEWGKKN